jgi:hypothetical protein
VRRNAELLEAMEAMTTSASEEARRSLHRALSEARLLVPLEHEAEAEGGAALFVAHGDGGAPLFLAFTDEDAYRTAFRSIGRPFGRRLAWRPLVCVGVRCPAVGRRLLCARLVITVKNSGDWPLKSPFAVRALSAPLGRCLFRQRPCERGASGPPSNGVG